MQYCGEHGIFVISIFYVALFRSVTVSLFHDYDSFLLLSVIMADPFRPRKLCLVANLSRVSILVGEFEGQHGRFISFSLPPNDIAAPNGTAHAVTTFHSNIFLDSELSVNVSASFLRLLHMDESSPFIRIPLPALPILRTPPSRLRYLFLQDSVSRLSRCIWCCFLQHGSGINP
jgi:hypothetical protein